MHRWNLKAIWLTQILALRVRVISQYLHDCISVLASNFAIARTAMLLVGLGGSVRKGHKRGWYLGAGHIELVSAFGRDHVAMGQVRQPSGGAVLQSLQTRHPAGLGHDAFEVAGFSLEAARLVLHVAHSKFSKSTRHTQPRPRIKQSSIS